MRRSIPAAMALALSVVAAPAHAGTFDRSALAPDQGIDALTRGVTQQRLGRALFANPYATVAISNTDVYAKFPYVETRVFQVISDSRWSRLVYGEQGKSVASFDGAGSTFGPLSNPAGMAVDEENHLYVADAGNDRVLVFRVSTEFSTMDLVPMFAINGLRDPHGVAYSDGGTPFVHGDDMLYVADTGQNRVLAFALGDGSARQVAALGELGSGRGRFAGPMAIAAGRSGGSNTPDVYVADAHTRRIVHLLYKGGAFQWIADRQHDADVVTSLDTDAWGNVYAAAPHQAVVRKFNAALEPVAELRGVSAPRGFHLPFATLRDHRTGRAERTAVPSALSVDAWTDQTGVNLWSLGVDVNGFGLDQTSAARFSLTDRADVTLELADAATGRSLWRRDAGTMDAGAHALAITTADLATAASASDPVLRLSAASSYRTGRTAVVTTRVLPSGTTSLPKQAALLGNSPNPVAPSTVISFAVPAAPGHSALRIYDAGGRVVRNLGREFTPGVQHVTWDGTDDRGQRLGAGVYFYRLEIAASRFDRKLVLVR